MKCSNCLLQRWNCVRLSFSNQEWCAKGVGVLSRLQVDSYSPDHSEPSRAEVWTLTSWITCWCHSLRSPQPESVSLSQHRPKNILWLSLRKIEVLLFSHSERESVPKTFPAFSICIISRITSYCVSFEIFYPLTPLVVLPPKKTPTYSQLFQQAQSNRTNAGFMCSRTWACK